MKRLYVKPAYRSRGVGRELVTAIVGRARELGYQRMRLDTLPESMAAAVELYRQFSFVVLPQRDPVVSSGLLEMELHL
jgi:carbonic anhydrase